MSENENGSKFHCPYCRGKRLQVATSTNFSTSTSVTRKQVTTTVESSNIRYWVCQDCGSTFPFPQDVEQQAINAANGAKSAKSMGILLAVLGGFLALVTPISPVAGAVGIISLVIAPILIFFVAPASAKAAETLYGDYAKLISKCMDD